MSERENFLRVLEFKNPHWIPVSVHLAWPLWHKYREELEEIVLHYPKIFKDYEKGNTDFDGDPGPRCRQREYFRDNWGCLWYTLQDGIEGQVVEHPLADWEDLDSYKPLDPAIKSPLGERDWEKIKKDVEEQKKKGLLTCGDGERLFDRLYYLRGFENLMIDIATDDPHLPKLIEMITNYEMKLVNKWLEIGVDAIAFHTDIGTQNALMISPVKFRRYIKPMFKKIFTTCRKAETHVLLSSDGRLLEIVDDLIECGVSRHDPQLRANTLKGIEKFYKGKMCIDLDLDRQMFPFCKPEDLRSQVKEVVERLNLPEGGLMIFGSFSDESTPLENIETLCQAFEEFCLK